MKLHLSFLSTLMLLGVMTTAKARPFHHFHHWHWGPPLIEFYPSFPDRPDREVLINPHSSAYEECEMDMPSRIAESGPAARMSWLKRCESDLHHYGYIF